MTPFSPQKTTRDEALALMNELENLVMKRGWPVPGTAYYLVNHQRMLALLDKLRLSLQDDLDARFIQAFGLALEQADCAGVSGEPLAAGLSGTAR